MNQMVELRSRHSEVECGLACSAKRPCHFRVHPEIPPASKKPRGIFLPGRPLGAKCVVLALHTSPVAWTCPRISRLSIVSQGLSVTRDF